MDQSQIRNLVFIAAGKLILDAQRIVQTMRRQQEGGTEANSVDAPEGYIDTIDRLIGALPKDHWLQSSELFLDMFFEEVPALPRRGSELDAEGVEALVDALCARLTAPPREYSFKVPVSCAMGSNITYPIGGPNLWLRATPTTAGGQFLVVLEGQVSAVTRLQAVAAGNRTVATLLGLAATMNLTMFRADIPPKACQFEFTGATPNDTYFLEPSLGAMALRTSWTPDAGEFSSFETTRIERGDAVNVLTARASVVATVMQATDNQGAPIRNAAALLCEALASGEFGRAVAFFLMSMESVLIEDKPGDVLARLAEAVAFRLGTSQGSRQRIRKEVKDLYGIRSRWVHSGRADCDHRARQSASQMAMKVLEKECWDFANSGSTPIAG